MPLFTLSNAVIGSGIFLLLKKNLFWPPDQLLPNCHVRVADIVMLHYQLPSPTTKQLATSTKRWILVLKRWRLRWHNVGLGRYAGTTWAAMLAGFAKIFIITLPAFWLRPSDQYRYADSLSLMNIARSENLFRCLLWQLLLQVIPIVLFSLFATILWHFRWREQELHTFHTIGKWNKPLQFYF